MQKIGICHRDLSLENLLVHKDGALIIDMGMCLLVPYCEEDPASLAVVGYYDLQADPGEMNTLPLDAEGSRLLALMESRIAAGHTFLTRPPTSALDPEFLEQIRALGYLEE